ncbi:DUF1127 domain-containing protein [Pikeienuella piscinae]|uniref:DUF1127 domain-containing protein n=1 Tax=Pikeienuella piscinae TaxID=2748098 RepID=A0A7L5BWS1_9RHOB|nr:DUF1127 domain-containing protein [Pikeienuella piscinae]QIE54039.1 DUF1127 domain-containing protein [Pikeienuella piscinae]
MAMVERVSNVSGGLPRLDLAPLAAAIVARFRARRAERRMLRLSDRMLLDIGVSRADLEARHPRLPSMEADAPRL